MFDSNQNKRGGRRLGAGRKKGFAAVNAEEARRLLSDAVLREIGPICEALITKAKEGNIAATRELFDRAWGRPPQAVAITSATTDEGEVVSSEDVVRMSQLFNEFLKGDEATPCPSAFSLRQ